MKDPDPITITTDGGTVFTLKGREVMITKSDQPQCVIPLADLREFLALVDLEEDNG